MSAAPAQSSTPRTPSVGRAGAIMMASLFLSRVLGIARDTIMAAMFGRTALTDAYVLAFQIPDLLFFLIAGGALSSAFIPVFSEYLHTERERDAWRIFSSVVNIMALFLLLVIAAAWIFAIPLAQKVAPGKSAELIPLIAQMSRILLPAQFAFFIGGLMFGTLYARQRFAVPGLGPNVYNLGIIFGALIISHFVSPGIVGMAIGALVGAVLGNLVIPMVAMAQMGSRYEFAIDWKHPGVRKVFRLMLPVVLGLSLPGVYAMIMRGYGSYFPEGVNTALDLSNKLMQAPLGIFGQSMAIAVFPALSQFFAQDKMDAFRAQLASTIRTVVFITIPISAVMLVLGQDIVAALLQYGKFKSADTAVVAHCLQMFSFGIAAWCLHPVIMRGFFAMHSSVKPIVIGTITTGVFLGLCSLFVGTGLGYLGLPLASSISAVVLVIMMLGVLIRDLGGFDLKGVLETVVKSLIAAAVMGGVIFALSKVLPMNGGVGRNAVAFGRLFLLGLGGAWLYAALARAMKMPETAYVERAMNRISRRRVVEQTPPTE